MIYSNTEVVWDVRCLFMDNHSESVFVFTNLAYAKNYLNNYRKVLEFSEEIKDYYIEKTVLLKPDEEEIEE